MNGEIFTNDEKSFANYTITERIPKIIEDVISRNSFNSYVNDSLYRLKDSIPFGRIERIEKESPFSKIFNLQIEAKNYTWDNAPFLLVENYLYYKLCDITKFFKYKKDFFQGIKNESIINNLEKLEKTFIFYNELVNLELHESFKMIVQLNLRGNKIDLSQKYDPSRENKENINCLVDDTEKAFNIVKHAKRVDLILDNSGVELFLDLLLSCWFLEKSNVTRVNLHFKSIPYFVSDAMESDFYCLIELINQNNSFKNFEKRLKEFIKNDNITFSTNNFWCSNQLFSEMPKNLKTDLKESDLIINKGDLNYRKLVGDIKWDPSYGIEKVVSYLPFDCLNIRILKSEVVLGIDKSKIPNSENTEWMYNGKNAIIQLCSNNKN